MQEPAVFNPIRETCENLPRDRLAYLREKYWKPLGETKEVFVIEACRRGQENQVAFAVFIAQSHTQLNVRDGDGDTVLNVAAACSTADLCRLIITKGCNGAIANLMGDTALHIACRRGHTGVIRALTSTLTKPEVKHPYFRVPYKSLPQDNVNYYNHDGRVPIHLAAENEHDMVVHAMASLHRCDVDYRRLGDGYAAAHIAIEKNNIKVLKACMNNNADTECRNFASETYLQLAWILNRTAMVLMLTEKYGAPHRQVEYALPDQDITPPEWIANTFRETKRQYNVYNFDPAAIAVPKTNLVLQLWARELSGKSTVWLKN